MVRPTVRRTQRGIALAVALIWLMVAMLLATSGTQIVLQDRKALTNLRDREIAFYAAEAGLVDAEIDIERAARAAIPQATAPSAQSMPQRARATDFPRADEALCHRGASSGTQGLCRTARGAETPAWLAIDLAGRTTDAVVPYGRFTGRTMQTGAGPLPARLPQYLIEQLRTEEISLSADAAMSGPSGPRVTAFWYRMTAIGFGVSAANQVVLQSYFRVTTNAHDALNAGGAYGTQFTGGARMPQNSQATQTQATQFGVTAPAARLSAERVGWREIPNWQELRQQLGVAREPT